MATGAAKWFIIASFTIGVTTAALAQDADIGRSLYQSSCGICHGIDGKGKGPLSEQLKVAPTDLTVLAKNNNGVFPVSAIYEVSALYTRSLTGERKSLRMELAICRFGERTIGSYYIRQINSSILPTIPMSRYEPASLLLSIT
jgi:hypothetical protein